MPWLVIVGHEGSDRFFFPLCFPRETKEAGVKKLLPNEIADRLLAFRKRP
jgi:hypothetical protein